MSLYNLKSSDGSWRITKFTNDLDVESSYLLSESECGCPAGSRPVCRHRTMLPKMLAVGAEDSGMFYDFDKDQFFEPLNEVTGAAGSAELVEPSTEPNLDNALNFLLNRDTNEVESDLSRTQVTSPTFNEPHSAIGPIKRRV